MSKLGEHETSGGFGVEKKEGGVEIFNEFLKGFLGSCNSGIGQLIIPHFGKGYSSSLAHFVECKSDLSFVSVVDGGVNVEVCADGLHPAHDVGRFS